MVSQGEKILMALLKADGNWINGRYFNNTMMVSQYHTRIHELIIKGHKIQASTFTDEYGFKSYRLEKKSDKKVITFNKNKKIETIKQEPLFNVPPPKQKPHYEFN